MIKLIKIKPKKIIIYCIPKELEIFNNYKDTLSITFDIKIEIYANAIGHHIPVNMKVSIDGGETLLPRREPIADSLGIWHEYLFSPGMLDEGKHILTVLVAGADGSEYEQAYEIEITRGDRNPVIISDECKTKEIAEVGDTVESLHSGEYEIIKIYSTPKVVAVKDEHSMITYIPYDNEYADPSPFRISSVNGNTITISHEDVFCNL